MADTKTLKLRAFSLVNMDINHNESNLLALLSNKLKDSVMNDRRMPINPDDPQHEEDLIANFDLRMKGNDCIMIAGTMLRIASVEDIPNITDDILNKQKVDIETLESIKSDSKVIYKSHYYFAVNNNYLVTTLPVNRTITAYQTYINEYLKDVREDRLYEFSPLLTKSEKVKFSDVKSIKIGSKDYNIGDASRKDSNSPLFVKRITNVAKDILKNIMEESKDLKQILDEEIVSAELVLKFSKRKNKAKETAKALSAFLKPISETDGIELTTKEGGKISASDVLKTKLVSIELTESKHLSEAQLFQEMEKFLSELK